MKLFSKKNKLVLLLPFSIYYLLITLYSLFSYSLTDPNLIIISWPPYQSFQTLLWQTFFENRHLMTYVFIALILLLFSTYAWMIRNLKENNKNYSTPKLLNSYLLLTLPLLLSYNALSHDVFNYMFNAKMVTVFHANPHVKVALDYTYDDWTRFMHNTHTPAPYGYGWTALSLIPSVIGFNKFLPTWLSFRLFSVISVALLFWSLRLLAQRMNVKLSLTKLAMVFLNPLFLLEIISNSHNDLWMMVPAIVSLALVTTPKTRKLHWSEVMASLALLAFSISTKFASVVLIPLWLVLIAKNNLIFQKISDLQISSFIQRSLVFSSQWISRVFNSFWPLLASALMFLPLFTNQSKQFLPWYLIWSLVWIPFVKSKVWIQTLLVFSLSSLLRYVPWLWAGGFEGKVEMQQKLVTWGIPALFIGLKLIRQKHSSKKFPPILKAKTI